MQVSKIFAGELLQYVSDHVEKGASYSFRVTAFNQIGHSKSLESEVILADDKYSKWEEITSNQIHHIMYIYLNDQNFSSKLLTIKIINRTSICTW